MYQKTIPNWIESTEKWDFNHPLAQKLYKSVFEMCVIDLKGWDEINSSGFQRVLQMANPKFELASPKYYASKLDQSFEKVKLKLKNNINFDNPENYSLSIDAWSQFHNGYLGINAHYITESWERKKLTLSCVQFNESHTGVNISKKTFNCVR